MKSSDRKKNIEKMSGIINGHKYVDLGLSVAWATVNIGATEPEEFGDLFLWGNPNPIKDGASYDLQKGTNQSLPNKGNVIGTKNDAASCIWKGGWRVPSWKELIELCDNCKTTELIFNGTPGVCFTSKINGNSIFFPYAGVLSGTKRDSEYGLGEYWSGERTSDNLFAMAHHMSIMNQGDLYEGIYYYLMGSMNINCGASIRPVIDILGKHEENDVYVPESNFFNTSQQAIDLGLSVKWGTCNIGANIAKGTGDYYAWGEIETKKEYSNENYKYCEGTIGSLIKYNVNLRFGNNVDYLTQLQPEDDIAHIIMGNNWRIPTYEELNELKEKCQWEWVEEDDFKGAIVTGPNGNRIFLPAAGEMVYDQIEEDWCGYYWAGNLHLTNFGDGSVGFGFLCDTNNDVFFCENLNCREHGLLIRPVCD